MRWPGAACPGAWSSRRDRCHRRAAGGARFSYVRRGGGIELGFRARAAHAVVDLAGCAVLLPEIVALLPALRRLLASLPMAGRAGEVAVTATLAGLDVLLIAAAEPGLDDREALAAFAAAEIWRASPGHQGLERCPSRSCSGVFPGWTSTASAWSRRRAPSSRRAFRWRPRSARRSWRRWATRR